MLVIRHGNWGQQAACGPQAEAKVVFWLSFSVKYNNTQLIDNGATVST